MATTFGDLVTALRDNVGNRLLTDADTGAQVTDARLMGVLRGALGAAKLHVRSAFAIYTVDGLVAGAVAATSTITPELVVDGDCWSLLLALAEWKLAQTGMLARGEENVGSTTVLGTTVNQTGRVGEHRANANTIWDRQVKPALQAFRVGDATDAGFVAAEQF